MSRARTCGKIRGHAGGPEELREDQKTCGKAAEDQALSSWPVLGHPDSDGFRTFSAIFTSALMQLLF